MFSREDIIYEDNHLLVVSKRCGDLVQPDPGGSTALEVEIKEFIRQRDSKGGEVFLGVVHRIDRPVSGLVLFAKSSKALRRMNELIRQRQVDKRYWAVVASAPKQTEAELRHYIARDNKQNRSRAYESERAGAKEARLRYKVVAQSKSFTLLEIELLTGRHHQIRAQLSKIGSPIKGDLKYGAPRSNPDGGISLHSRSMTFIHPIRKEELTIIAPTPKSDELWSFFDI
ncbi:MAG: RluA family pseudouridine synthase [Rikenellaceae bacterium]